MDVSVIIVSYNVKYYIYQCIDSVLKASKNLETEIIVVDNQSHDNTIEFLSEHFRHYLNKSLILIKNKENLGFGKANNQALRIAQGKYILYLNPDTIISEDSLEKCYSFLNQTPNAGAVGVKMLNPNGSFALESRRGIPTPFTSFCKLSGLARLFPKSTFWGKYYMQYLSTNQICPIDIVSGAFMMASRSLLNKLNGFDEQFFMYGEDIDLSYRILQLGLQNYYIPTRILHYKGESTNKASKHYVNVFHEAMLLFYKKHFHNSIFLSLPIRCAINLLILKSMLHQWKVRAYQAIHHKKEETYKIVVTATNESLPQFNSEVPIEVLYSDTMHQTNISSNYIYQYCELFNPSRQKYSDILKQLEDSTFPIPLGTYHENIQAIITPYQIIKTQ